MNSLLNTVTEYIRGKYPRTYTLLKIREIKPTYVTILTPKMSIYVEISHGEYLVEDDRGVTRGDDLNIQCSQMTDLEEHWSEISRDANDVLCRPIHTLRHVRTGDMRALITISGFILTVGTYELIVGRHFPPRWPKKIINRIEKLLRDEHINREAAMAVITQLPQPIAEEIMENF